MSKDILILIIIVIIVIVISICFYFYLFQKKLPEGVLPETIPLSPEEVSEEKTLLFFQKELSEEEFKEKHPDFLEGIVKIEVIGEGEKSVKRAILLTEDNKTYYLIPGNELFLKQQEIKEGDKIEIQGRIEKIGDRSHFFIGKIL